MEGTWFEALWANLAPGGGCQPRRAGRCALIVTRAFCSIAWKKLKLLRKELKNHQKSYIAGIAVTCVHYIVLVTGGEYNRIHEFKKCISMMAISDSELCEVLVQGLQL